MPMHTQTEAIMAVVMVRSFLIPSKINGTTKLQNTMVQKNGA